MFTYAVSALLLAILCAEAHGQVCRISTSGLNRNRRVAGPVHAECPVSIHSVPFGNWGVTSNFGPKLDGAQFEGWCHASRVCDTRGNCRTECLDGWYEWNSCTDIEQYRPPNCTLYNDANCTAQVSTRGVNVHGTKTVDLTVRCPTSPSPGAPANQGGCADIRAFDNGSNFLSLYEIDPGSTDDLIQTVYFPVSSVSLNCDVFGCAPAQSPWVTPIGFDSPTSPAKITAEFSMTVNSAVFVDTSGACRAVGPVLSTVPGASFRQTAVAAASIASVFGAGLSTTTGTATLLPLPIELAGTRVSVTDAAGTTRAAPLFYVSPNQVNIQIPPQTGAGTAQIIVSRSDSVTARGTVTVAASAPDLFSARGDGLGVAAATAILVSTGGTVAPVPVFRCDAQPSSCVPVPLPLRTGTVYLTLYGTGIRGAANVSVTIGGTAVPVLYAGPQGQFVGLDQVNVPVPDWLSGRGTLPVVVQGDGRASNSVTIAVE